MLTATVTAERTSPHTRVLVVDDTPDVRFMVAWQLKSEGAAVEEAVSGEQALSLCASESFDAIVLDQRMPGLTGIEVARKLRADLYPAPIVIYSAYVDETLRAEALSLEIPIVDKADNERLRTFVRTALSPVA
jgi:CheY-like chemotaxis protein